MKRVLIVAGSDSGGGAGIQADVRTVSALGLWPATAVTALTAQNTRGVQGIHEVPSAFVAEQIRSVLSDIGADAVKVGMLQSRGVVEAVAEALSGCKPVVVDPVLATHWGTPLLEASALGVLKEKILPLATVITPNLREAEVLTGTAVRTPGDMEKAGAHLVTVFGCEAALIKGGHGEGSEVLDVLVTAKGSHCFRRKRLPIRNAHGTGCTLSSAVASFLALGSDVVSAAREAGEFLMEALRGGIELGKGARVLDHFAALTREAERYRVLQALSEAYRRLRHLPFASLVPEVQSNMAFALRGAETLSEVAAFPGRIVRVGNEVVAPAGPCFGASRHVAHVVLAVMREEPELRACINIRYGPDVLSRLERAGLRTAFFSRDQEPPEVKAREGATLGWGCGEALRRSGGAVDAICDPGEAGKEPMVRLLGRDPAELIEKLGKILSPG